MLTALIHSEAAPEEATFEPASDHAGPFSPKVHIRSAGSETAFEEVRFAPHVLSSGLLVISRHSGYKVGNFVHVVFSHLAAGEMNEPAQRAEIIHILPTNRGDMAIGLRFQPSL